MKPHSRGAREVGVPDVTIRQRIIGVAAALLAAALLATAPPAVAAEPTDLEQGFVTDQAGVLSDAEEQRLEEQLSELAQAAGRPELYVILVPDFDNPPDALRWADATALHNNLAPDQYLLAIATTGHTLAISAEYGGDGTPAGPLSESRVLEIEKRLGSEYLRTDDWAGGIAFVAAEFDEVPWPWWVWALSIGVLAGLVFVVTLVVRSVRRRAALARELRTLDGQKQRAARQIVRTDEAVRTSEQELGFVTAEFGEETTAGFHAVLAECRSHLESGFELLRLLEDATEDTPEQTRAWTSEILRLCAQIDKDLEGRRRELASLRALADGADQTLERLRAARADADALAQQASEKLETLNAAFAPAQLVGIAENPADITRRLASVDAELVRLEQAVRRRRAAAISVSVHEIERDLAEAAALRDAIDAHAKTLASGVATAQAGVATLERARAAVGAAEAAAQARPGGLSALALSRLDLARRRLAEATATTDADQAEQLATSALDLAHQVQGLASPSASSSPTSPPVTRAAARAASSENAPLMYDAPGERASVRRTASDDEPSSAGRVIWGAVGGAVVGGVGGLGLEPGAALLFAAVGAVMGAIFSAFGSSGGSSSGWGGSSYRSGRSSSRSSGSRSFSSRRSSSRSSSSRRSGRSGGRRF